MSDSTNASTPARPAWLRPALRILTATVILLLLVFLWRSLPEGYPTDLSVIGNGQPALVLLHDAHRVASGEQMEALNEIRAGLEARELQLIVTNLQTQEGAEFAMRHGGDPADVLLFTGDGTLKARIQGPQPGPELRQHIYAALWPDATEEAEL